MKGVGCRVYGLGFRALGKELRVQDLRFFAYCLDLRVLVLEFRV